MKMHNSSFIGWVLVALAGVSARAETPKPVVPDRLFHKPGLIDEDTGKTVDLTAQVGLVRRKWIKLDPWNSRDYYPVTPLYSSPRAWT